MAGFTLLALAGALARTAAVDAQAPSAWDGVYTEAQAARAASAFDQSCASCHTLAAEGKNPLSGERFWEGFAQRSVGELLTYVSANMPNGRGGSLPESTYADLVALILKSNGFPAGAKELGPDAAAAQIVPRSGSSELPANALVRVVGCLAQKGGDWILTNATAPRRIDGGSPAPEDATRPLGSRTMALKFVLTKLDSFVGQRMSVSGMLIGEGGVDGLNVTTVNRVAASCP